MKSHVAAQIQAALNAPLKAEAIMSRMREGLIILDEQDRISHLNSAAAWMLGTSEEVLLGRCLDMLPAEIANAPLTTACGNARRHQQAVQDEFYFVPSQSWIELRAVPHGHQLLLFIWKRSLRRGAEQFFTEILERFELIAQTTSDLIWDWNILEGRMWRSEGAEQFLDSPEGARETSNEFWLARVALGEEERVRREFERIVNGDDLRGILEYPITRKDGRIVHLAERILVLRDQTGRPIRAVGCIRDVSDQRRLETQLRRAQRLESVGRVASGIAHDLNNILTPISMALDLLSLDANDSHERKVMESLQKSISHGASLLQILLMFARGSEGEKTLLDPRQVALDVLQIARETFPRSVRLVEDYAEGVPAVVGNSTQLRQVLLNLLMNARDAMANSGTLTIRVWSEAIADETAQSLGLKAGPHVIFSVVDNGPGIPSEILDKIWDPFFTTKDEGQGTGLGLSTASAIVDAHKGAIHVCSKPGDGTMFYIYLPATDQPIATPPSPACVEKKTSDAHHTILLIDADPAIRLATQRILERRGFNVLIAEVEGEAREHLEAGRPKIDLLIFDLMLPFAERLKTIASLRARFPSLPIIATSGHRQELSEDQEAQIDAFLPKPFTGPELLFQVESTLETTR